MTNDQCPMPKTSQRLGHWEFIGHWSLVIGHSHLVIGHFSSRTLRRPLLSAAAGNQRSNVPLNDLGHSRQRLFLLGCSLLFHAVLECPPISPLWALNSPLT